MMSFYLSGGVEVLGFISPTEPTDEYPVIDPLYGIDGFRNVDTLSELNSIPNLRRRAGMVVGISGGTEYYKLNPSPWNGTITDWAIFNSGGGSFTGGTVTGDTIFTQGVTATTFSASTYLGLPLDVYTTGLTFNPSNYNLSLERNDGVILTQSLSILASDVTITGGTYDPLNGSITFINNTGGTFTVTGFITGFTDVQVTGYTYQDNTFTIFDSSGNTFSTTIDSVTGLTVNGILSATTYEGLPLDVYITGGTYSNGKITFVNNSGGTFDISGLYTGETSYVNSLTTGTGLSGNTTSGDITIINTAPDQTVTISGGTGILTGGTYPNFTIINTEPDQIVTISGGTGILTGGTYPNFTIINTEPDQIVTISGGTNIEITGIYPNFGVNFTGDTSNFFTGGTVTGDTIFTQGLTATTFSATTYLGLPLDVYTTGFTFNPSNYDISIKRNDGVILTQNLSILASDVTITGGTYNPLNGVATFTNNTGGTFDVSGFITGFTDVQVTGYTYQNNTFTIFDSSGNTFPTTIDVMTGLTINGDLNVTGSTTSSTFYGDGSNLTGISRGGAGGKLFYFNISNTQSPYYEFSTSGTTSTEQTISTSTSPNSTSLIGGFMTPSGVPNITDFPAGILSFYLHTYDGNTNHSFDIYCELYKRTTGGTETLLFTSDPAAVIGNVVTMVISDGYFSGATLNTSDRLVVKVYGTNLTNQTRTIYFVSEGSQHYSFALTTIPTFNDTFVTGFTYNNNTLLIKQNNNQPDLPVTINTMTGLTINGNLTVTGNTSLQGLSATTISAPGSPTQVIYNNGGVLSADTGFVYSGGSVGIGTTTPSSKLEIKAAGTNAATYSLKVKDFSNTVDLLSLGDTGIFSLNHPTYTGTFSIRMTANNTVIFDNSAIGNFIKFGPTNTIDTLGQEIVSLQRGAQFGSSLSNPVQVPWAVHINNLPAQSSGTTNVDALRINPTINNTGTYTGINRGIYYNPTLTSLSGTTHRAIETTTGDVLFGSTSGNVGIGTTNPTEKLDVSGKTKTINLQVTSGATTGYVLTSDSSGNATWQIPSVTTNTYTTGFTYNNNTFTISDNSGSTYSATINVMTGLTINGTLSATTISASTYYNLPTDVYVTGGTYSNGTTTFTNNTGGTFNVTGYFTGSTGMFGIANSNGVYTFYSTLQSAITAASAGQTVEMFTDYTETGAVTVNLKDGVNINLNGHTYTLSNTGTTNCLQDNGAAINSIISNGIIKRVLGAASSTNTLCLYVTGASNIIGYNLKLIQDLTTGLKTCLTINNASAIVTGVNCIGGNPTVVNTNGTLLDSNVISLNGGGISNAGIIKNCFGKGLNVSGISNSGTAYNCVGQDDYVIGFDNTGYAFNCVGRSTGATGYRGGGVNYGCSGYSNGGVGYFVNGSTQNYKCFGYSTASNGISMINGIIDSCMAVSTVAAAIATTNSGGSISEIKNCHAISYAAVAITIGNTTSNNIVYKTLAESYWNNVAGHSISVSSAGANSEIIQCILRTVNASTNAINSSVAKTVNFAQNTYKGMTTPINANITQGITNTQDNQGNILI